MLDDRTLDQRRETIAGVTPSKTKSNLGQFMTPSIIANYMAAMFRPLSAKKVFLLDAGAGIGSLSAAFVQRAIQEHCESLVCEAWEIDELLQGQLQSTLQGCNALAEKAGISFHADIREGDFILDHANLFSTARSEQPTHAILNPPYKKISSNSANRRTLRKFGIETSNLYSAFVSLALKSLRNGGELVAITPRSFCNGTYFRPFRELLLTHASITQIHVFKSRTHAFKTDDVLQENVIFHLVKGEKQKAVRLTTSADATFSDFHTRAIEFSEFVLANDKEKVFHLPEEEDVAHVSHRMGRYGHRLDKIGLGVSTGPVVDFRLRDHLRALPDQNNVPLVYAHHFDTGFIKHPKENAKKANYIAVNGITRKWLMPKGPYTLVRRLSSKEERRRIIPAVFDPSGITPNLIGFENHLNVFHSQKSGLPIEIAKGLAVYLGSSFADRWLRRFSGWPAPGFEDTEIRCFYGTGGGSWRDGSSRGSSSLRLSS